MNVCDMCRETPLEEEKVVVSFRAVKKHAERFVHVEGSELSGCKEICADCCRTMQKLFKKGGDTE